MPFSDTNSIKVLWIKKPPKQFSFVSQDSDIPSVLAIVAGVLVFCRMLQSVAKHIYSEC